MSVPAWQKLYHVWLSFIQLVQRNPQFNVDVSAATFLNAIVEPMNLSTVLQQGVLLSINRSSTIWLRLYCPLSLFMVAPWFMMAMTCFIQILLLSLGVFPKKKRFNRFILSGLRKSLLFPQNTRTHKSISRIVSSKIQLQPCLKILERITTS